MNTPAEAPIRILLVDDHTLVREGLREILESYEDLRVVGGAATAREGVALAARLTPDVVLLDVGLPGGPDGGVGETVRLIRERAPRCRVVILSMFDDPGLLRRLVTAGVRGYLLKSVTRHELVSAVRAVHGDAERMVLSVSHDTLVGMQTGSYDCGLSEREREILALVAQALSNGQIAGRLGVTEATVKRHLRRIFARLGAVSRIDAVNKATAAGVVPPRGSGPPGGGPEPSSPAGADLHPRTAGEAGA